MSKDDSFNSKKLIFEALAQTQQSKQLPDWFVENTTIDRKEWDHFWVASFYMFLRQELRENEAWEKIRGSWWRVKTDPASGKKMVTIIHDLPDDQRVDLFEVDIDSATNEIAVRKSVELSTIDPKTLYIRGAD